MIAAILSAGPSLTETWEGRGTYDVVIGVNRAASLFPCDWWVGLDYQAFTKYPPIGYPRVLTYERSVHRLSKGDHAARWANHEVVVHNALRQALRRSVGSEPQGAGMFHFSSAAAFCWAVAEGAKQVDTYGHDMAGEYDCEGERAGGRRDSRWRRERGVWNKLLDWADTVGVKVTIYQPSPDQKREA